MSTTVDPTPTSRLRFGVARTDITPPVGIYHPMWGAARHQRATGVHRPLTGEVMVFSPIGQRLPGLVRAQLDMVGLDRADHEKLRLALAQTANVPEEQVIVAYSHTHSGGFFAANRVTLPGGELIRPYLDGLCEKMAVACRQAMAAAEESLITYAVGRCDMAANRDYWDVENGIYTCGYNPDAAAAADDTVMVARITNLAGRLVAVLVNYACHPTTLAWENTLISPDYVGALREVVEAAAGAPCVFSLGACGDLGPRQSHQGNTAVADKNGRQLGYAALSALESMGPPAADFGYMGPVVSGATLGTWSHSMLSSARLAAVSSFAGGRWSVDLPKKPLPSSEQLQAELDDWLARQRQADADGDAVAARDYGARAERARRWLGRIQALPAGPTYPFHFTVHRLGDAIWVTTGGEPYNVIQTELRRRFAGYSLVFSVMAGEMSVAYLLPADRYGKGLYQEEPSILDKGCLELLTDAVAGRVAELL